MTTIQEKKSPLMRFLFAFQHMFAMLGATITVPMLTGMNISLALISAGLGTIAFHFIAKKKVPVFLGSSFAFLPALQSFFVDGWSPETAGKVAIAIVCTGLVYVIISLLIKLIGTGFIKRLFPPIVVGPVIMCIGLGLAPSAVNNIQSAGGPGWIAAIATIITIIVVSIYCKGYIKMLPILFGFVVGYIVSLCFGLVSFDGVKNAAWIIFQPDAFNNAFGFYKYLGFDWSMILAIAPIALVTFMEHIGDIKANGAVVGQDFLVDPGLHRTLLGDGVGTMIAGFIGGCPNTTYGENTAVLAITKNYDPKNIVNAAILAVILGIFTKFGGLLETIPACVVGGASFVLYGMISAQGLKALVDGKVDFNQNRNLIIGALILVLGLGLTNVSIMIGTVKISAIFIATFVGIIANIVLPMPQTEEFASVNLAITGLDEVKEDERIAEEKSEQEENK